MSPDDPTASADLSSPRQSGTDQSTQDATSTRPIDSAAVRELAPTHPSPHHVPRAGLIAGAVAASALVLYLIAVIASGGGVKAGTHILGIDIGGLSHDEATVKLDDELSARASAPLDVMVGKRKFAVDPSVAGVSLDSSATVDSVGGRTWNPWDLVQRAFGSEDVAPVVVVNEGQLAASIAKIAATVDRKAIEPGIVLQAGNPTLRIGKKGFQVDQAAAVGVVSSAYLVTTKPLVLPTRVTEPAVSDEQAQAALTSIAKPAVASPVAVVVTGDKTGVRASIPPTTIAAALSFSVLGGAIAPKLDGVILKSAIAKDVAALEQPGHDAHFKIVGGKPVVVPSRVGNGVAPDALAAAVLSQLSKVTNRIATVALSKLSPALTTEQARALGITEKLSSFTQNFPYAPYRVQNIGQAAKYMNGTLLTPGDTYSMNNTIKERTVANGYTVGIRIGADGHFVEDLGGGVSTITTATWTAAFYAGLERIEQRAHSIYISRYRPGLEATVAWGSLDLRFRDDTGHGVLIRTIMRNTSITVTIYGTKKYSDIKAVSGPRYDVRPPKRLYDPLPTCVHQSPEDGFSIDVYRVFYQNGVEVRREKLTSSYRPSDEVICKPDPAKATPSPSGSGLSTSPKPTLSPTN